MPWSPITADTVLGIVVSKVSVCFDNIKLEFLEGSVFEAINELSK